MRDSQDDSRYPYVDDVIANMIKASHPCYGGEGQPLAHSFTNGECEDCGAEDDDYCAHDDCEYAPAGMVCNDCGEVTADWNDLREDFENEQADARRDDWLWESENR